jgi:hypothetical protein
MQLALVLDLMLTNQVNSEVINAVLLKVVKNRASVLGIV